MITLAKVQAAVKAAPHYRVRVGHLEVIGTPPAVNGRWSFDYIVRNAPRAGDGRLFTAYGRANAAEYLEARGAYLAIEEVTLAPKCDAVAPTIASYRTHIEGRSALGYSRHGVLLFSFVPRLMGYDEPSFADALAILNGEQIIVAMAVHNRAQAARPDAGKIADAMLRESREVLKLGTTMVSVPMTEKPRYDTSAYDAMIARPNGRELESRFIRHIMPNRARAALLRARHATHDTMRMAAYQILRGGGSTARDAIELARACDPRGIAKWAEATTGAVDAARAVAIQAAVDELAMYLREDRAQITNPRKAFRALYGINRVTPAFYAAVRKGA
ncbi:hypothetical protein Nazgul06 [Burkholderia phage BcepNazgul]|uniref:Uncharacterized protein n=1 Tax=Burkholderia phage BcepNazgul TaxID=242861 RepID=Q6UYF9_9CAUD|nr:hypothetical protein Nazgul06 [Burkholderia phage BcepNazgul]AAQ63382.1 hypothetical protein Nazgul06 [Burkholderia phage BcepNazgul]